MRRIDFYVQHLLRHNAQSIELGSGRPVTFKFPDGDRRSNSAIEHATVMQLVQEVAPPETITALRQNKPARFDHDAHGVSLRVEVDPSGPGSWRVRITPRTGRTPAPQPAVRDPGMVVERPVGGAMAGAEHPPRSLPPPEVRAVEGEPAIHRFLREMVELGASDLHLSSGVPPMVRLDGHVQQLGDRPPFEAEALRGMLAEIMPEKNVTEFEETQDTDFAHEIEGVARFRANYFVDRKGPGAVFRVIPFEILSVDQIGLPQQVLDLCWLSKGLVLVTGPTGSGKSTTLATLVDYINQHRNDHIITIEDPVEFVHDNKKCLVNQREIGTHTSSFKTALRAALREDPDIVLVGEMRDLETIAIAIETAETGHLVFGTLHTTSAPSTVDRIIDQFPPEQQEQIRVMLSESLRGVIAQVLCRKKGGGRAAAYEVLITTPAVSNLIREGKTYQLTSVMQTGKNLGMQTMNEHLLTHVKEGRIEAREAYVKSNDKVAMRDMLQRNGIQLEV